VRKKKKSTAQRRSRCLDSISSIISIEVKVKITQIRPRKPAPGTWTTRRRWRPARRAKPARARSRSRAIGRRGRRTRRRTGTEHKGSSNESDFGPTGGALCLRHLPTSACLMRTPSEETRREVRRGKILLFQLISPENSVDSACAYVHLPIARYLKNRFF
jgi:hypothetical protein